MGNDNPALPPAVCVQLGISIRDLDLLTVGMVNDMFCELHRDDETFDYVATQEDFDKF